DELAWLEIEGGDMAIDRRTKDAVLEVELRGRELDGREPLALLGRHRVELLLLDLDAERLDLDAEPIAREAFRLDLLARDDSGFALREPLEAGVFGLRLLEREALQSRGRLKVAQGERRLLRARASLIEKDRLRLDEKSALVVLEVDDGSAGLDEVAFLRHDALDHAGDLGVDIRLAHGLEVGGDGQSGGDLAALEGAEADEHAGILSGALGCGRVGRERCGRRVAMAAARAEREEEHRRERRNQPMRAQAMGPDVMVAEARPSSRPPARDPRLVGRYSREGSHSSISRRSESPSRTRSSSSSESSGFSTRYDTPSRSRKTSHSRPDSTCVVSRTSRFFRRRRSARRKRRSRFCRG